MSVVGVRVTRDRDHFIAHSVNASVHSYEAIRQRVPNYVFQLAIYQASFPCPFAKLFPLTVGISEAKASTRQAHIYHFCEGGSLMSHRQGAADINRKIVFGGADMDISFLRERLQIIVELLGERKPHAYFREHPAVAKLMNGSL